MTEQLHAFTQAAEELANGKYIIADVKIANLLKTIARSKTMLALLENCLLNFDYEQAKTRYYVKNKFSADKKDFVIPQDSKEIIAFVFNVLMDIDSKRVDFGEFLNKFFFEDGSFSAAYINFVQKMIKPFVEQITAYVNGVIDGSVQDPILLLEQEQQKEVDQQTNKEEQVVDQTYLESVKSLKAILLDESMNVKQSNLDKSEVDSLNIIVDTFASALDLADKNAITYAWVAYGYACRVHKNVLGKTLKQVDQLVKEIVNGL